MASYYAAALHSFSRPFRVAYPRREAKGATLWLGYVKAHWTKIAVAAGLGMLVGFVAGVVSSHFGLLSTPVVYAAPSPARNFAALKPQAPTAANQIAQDELTRLRTQNEHLEAMLAEFQKTPPPAHARRAKARHRRRARAHA